MKIIVDVMGGDKAPSETVKGAYFAAQETKHTLVLVGDKNEIERIAAENQFDLQLVEVVHTEDVITMNDDPLSVTRAKKHSSMSVGLKMLADGEGDAFVSTGNTGALFTGATLIVRKIKGVQRAGIGTLLPLQNKVLLFDSGANVTVTEENLEQFGVIGSAYMHKMFSIEKPRIGLLNNGTETCKGTALQQAAHRLLAQNPDIHFVGNIEGSMLPFDTCDVAVTDGFTGNIVLKSIEGTGKLMLKKLKHVFLSSWISKLSYLGVKKSLGGMRRDLDPSEHGGAPILGIAKPVVKAHGSSDAKAFKNAIHQAVSYAESGIIEDLNVAMAAYVARKKSAKEARCGTETLGS